MKKNYLFIGAAVTVVVLVAAGVYYFSQRGRKTQVQESVPLIREVSREPKPESLGEEIYKQVSNPAEKIPNVNPFQVQTNPLEEVKTNPFEGVYKNPFE